MNFFGSGVADHADYLLAGGAANYGVVDQDDALAFDQAADGIQLELDAEVAHGLLRLDEASACAETRELAVHKLALIKEKLVELTAMRKGLAALVSKCGPGDNRACPIIHMLVTD